MTRSDEIGIETWRGHREGVQPFGDSGNSVVPEQLGLLLAVIEDLQKRHPKELVYALRVDADVLAHDVLDGFDGVG